MIRMLLAALVALPCSNLLSEPITFVVREEVVNPVKDDLFGQFLEIASWGEPGPEALVDRETGELPSMVVEKLREMHASFVRFPVGSDIDNIDWADRVTGAFGREQSERPNGSGEQSALNNQFGYDEFLRLAEELSWTAVIPVATKAPMLGESDPAIGARRAAELVAYCKAPVGAALPDGMPDWPGLREANGHPEPYGVKRWQIGNECFMFLGEPAKAASAEEIKVLGARVVQCVVAYAEAMLAVDPNIEFVFDAWLGEQRLSDFVIDDPAVKKWVKTLTLHKYEPWEVKSMTVDGEAKTGDDVPISTLWNAWVSMPAAYDSAGQALAFDPEKVRRLADAGYRVAMTEWNWNGWKGGTGGANRNVAALAKGIGVGGFLNGLIRQGDEIDFANQSMMLGVSWNIAAIAADPSGEGAPFIRPTGLATALYSAHHGDRRLAVDSPADRPAITQDVQINEHVMHSPLFDLDVVATRDEQMLYLHIVRRGFEGDVPVRFDVSNVAVSGAAAQWHRMMPNGDDARSDDAAKLKRVSVPPPANGIVEVRVPARSVSVLEIPLAKQP